MELWAALTPNGDRSNLLVLLFVYWNCGLHSFNQRSHDDRGNLSVLAEPLILPFKARQCILPHTAL